MLDTNFWKKYFRDYDVLNVLIPYQELKNEIIKNLEIKNGDKVLDLGSGTGNIAIEWRQGQDGPRIKVEEASPHWMPEGNTFLKIENVPLMNYVRGRTKFYRQNFFEGAAEGMEFLRENHK